MMLAVVAVGDPCTEAVEAAEAVVQVIFNDIKATLSFVSARLVS